MAEAIVGASLLVLVALGMSSLITGLKDSGVKIEGSGACRQHAADVINKFKQADHRGDIPNWQPDSHAPTNNWRPTATEMQSMEPDVSKMHLERVSAFPIIDADGIGNVTYDKTNAWMLINSGTNWALALYNNTAAVCGGNGGKGLQLTQGGAGWADQYFPTGNLLDPSEQVFLSVKKYDTSLASLVAGCPNQGTSKIIPRGLANAADPATKYGLQVESTVEFLDKKGIRQTCRASTIMRPDGDVYPSNLVQPPADVLPAGCVGWPAAPGNAACSVQGSGGKIYLGVNTTTIPIAPGPPPVAKDVMTWNIAIAYNEPAIVLACALEYRAPTTPPAPPATPATTVSIGNTFQPCGSFSKDFGGGNIINGSIVKRTARSNALSAVQIELSNLVTAGNYTIFIKAFDQAQNESLVAVNNPPVICIPKCPADKSQYCSATAPVQNRYSDGCSGWCDGTATGCPAENSFCGDYIGICGNNCHGSACGGSTTETSSTPLCDGGTVSCRSCRDNNTDGGCCRVMYNHDPGGHCCFQLCAGDSFVNGDGDTITCSGACTDVNEAVETVKHLCWASCNNPGAVCGSTYTSYACGAGCDTCTPVNCQGYSCGGVGSYCANGSCQYPNTGPFGHQYY